MASFSPRLSLHNPHTPKGAPPPTVCCIYPYSVDKLRLINFPPNLLPALRIAIQTSWKKGIQSEGINDRKTCYEVKLRGYPWSRNDNSTVVLESCRLTTSIMRFMLSHGWGLELSTHLPLRSRHDSWFFRKTNQETHVVMCSISFSLQDKIRVIDGTPEVNQAIRSTIENHWYRGLQQQKVYDEAEEFKLKGRPWNDDLEKTYASALIMYLIEALKTVGWNLYASVGTGGTGRVEMDAWVLKKSRP